MSKTLVVIAEDRIGLQALEGAVQARLPHLRLHTVLSAGRAVKELGKQGTSLVLWDTNGACSSHAASIAEATRSRPETPIVLIAPPPSRIDTMHVLQSVGVYQYLPKPIDRDDLLRVVRVALEVSQLARYLKALRLTIAHGAEKLQAMEDIARNTCGELVPIRNPAMATRLLASRKLRQSSIGSVTKVLHTLDQHHCAFARRHAAMEAQLVQAYASGWRESVQRLSSL